MCAQRGLPIGILTEDGHVYLLLEDHAEEDSYEEAKDLAGKKAEVKGHKYSKPGIDGVVVSAVKGL